MAVGNRNPLSVQTTDKEVIRTLASFPREKQALVKGSTLASGRETDRISFATLFGSDEAAGKYLDKMVDMANTTPFLYEDLKSMSKTLATYKFDENSILPVLRTVGDAGAALGMAANDMNYIATALGRMKTSDKTTLEYLNILNDRGIGAVGYLAEARGKSVGETYDDISKGEISGTEAVDIILAAMERDFSGSMMEQSKTFSGLTSTLEGLTNEISNAAGEGYNTIRKSGLESGIAAYSGALGDALKAQSELQRKNQAYLENLREQYKREALERVLVGNVTSLYGEEAGRELLQLRQEYVDAARAYREAEGKGEYDQEAAQTMLNVQAQAEAIAQAAYDSSEQAQSLEDSNLELMGTIRDGIAATDNLAGAMNSLRESVERSKGLGATEETTRALAGRFLPAPIAGIGGNADFWRQASGATDEQVQPQMLNGTAAKGGSADFWSQAMGGYATGLNRVPYDNFPALLHEGERVLTASEARAADREGFSGGVNIHIDQLSVREEADVDRIAEALADKLWLARMAG